MDKTALWGIIGSLVLIVLFMLRNTVQLSTVAANVAKVLGISRFLQTWHSAETEEGAPKAYFPHEKFDEMVKLQRDGNVTLRMIHTELVRQNGGKR